MTVVNSAIAAQKDKLLLFLVSQVKDTKHPCRTTILPL